MKGWTTLTQILDFRRLINNQKSVSTATGRAAAAAPLDKYSGQAITNPISGLVLTLRSLLALSLTTNVISKFFVRKFIGQCKKTVKKIVGKCTETVKLFGPSMEKMSQGEIISLKHVLHQMLSRSLNNKYVPHNSLRYYVLVAVTITVVSVK